MSNPTAIYAITQFTGGTGAVWRGLTQPIPLGVLTIESDTGIVKRGDGITTYTELPVFFNALYLQDVAVSATATQNAALAAATSANEAAAYAQQAQSGNRVSARTIDATPVFFTGMGAVPDGISTQRIVGQITAQNSSTGDAIAWDISALAIRRGTGLTVATPLLPTVTPYYSDVAMATCQLNLTITTTGFVLIATGLAGTTINWTGTLMVSGTTVQQ